MAERARSARPAAPPPAPRTELGVHAGTPNPVDFDPLIHGRVRLGIVGALAVEEWLSFNELKERLEITDGNLSVHARRLEDAAYVEVQKSFDGRIPRTDYRLTPAGRNALERYLDHMEALIERVRE